MRACLRRTLCGFLIASGIILLGAELGTTPETHPGTEPGSDPGANPGKNPGGNPGTKPGTAPGNGHGTTRSGFPASNGVVNISSNGSATDLGGRYTSSGLAAATVTAIYSPLGDSTEFGSLAKATKLLNTGTEDSSLTGIGMGALVIGVLLLALLRASKPRKVG